MEKLIPSIRIWRIQQVANSNDAQIRNLLHSSAMQTHFEKLWVKAGGVPKNTPDLSQIRTPIFEAGRLENESPMSLPPSKICYPVLCDWRKEEIRWWIKLPVRGKGIECFQSDKISNTWLKSHQGFQERHFISALQLRANVYPTRETLSPGCKDAQQRCRKCSARVKSCSHILGQYLSVQGARIARHNKICAILVKEARHLDWEVYQEPHLKTTEGQLRKPDLVFVKDSDAEARQPHHIHHKTIGPTGVRVICRILQS